MLANLNFIVLLAAVIGVMWLLLFLKDLFAAKCARRLKLKERIWYDDFEAKWHNLAQRFTYEIFLELVICIMISLAVRVPYTDDNFSDEAQKQARYEGVGGDYEVFDYAITGTILFLTSCFFIWAISFAW